MITTYLRPTLTDHGLVVARTLTASSVGTAEAIPNTQSQGNETSGTASSTLGRQNDTASDTSGESN
jgi:hypothetical protein